MNPDKVIAFRSPVDDIDLPERFTFPFYYTPHPLAELAASELQEHYLEQNNWEHNFGLDKDRKGLVIGKMFGVLVVRDKIGKLGYLAAFSGKLENQNHHEGFVPPVYDMLHKDSFFLQGAEEIDSVTKQIEMIESSDQYQELIHSQQKAEEKAEEEIESYREFMRQAKAIRKQKREAALQVTGEDEFNVLNNELIKESLHHKHQLSVLTKDWEDKIAIAKERLEVLTQKIDELKSIRKEMSAQLQSRIFTEYAFLNAKKESKSLNEIFTLDRGIVPPAGSGECAAPKLLHYAYTHDLQPIALAEFWWGASPKSEIRKHGHFYPSCRGKCEPILGHMLAGLDVDPNPMIVSNDQIIDLEIAFEDEDVIVVNKPAEFLSVPGKEIKDSVYQRILDAYPKATGPLIVHRLDMATSGLLVLAKNKEANKELQKQFIERTVRKRYVAVLDGIINEKEGLIDLPLRLDIDDRPRQLVCYEHGKRGLTKWELISTENNRSRVYFYPITGRTHQLRVHAAHSLGLDTPIVGDDLYGMKDSRLHLHADRIQFRHPITNKKITLQIDPDF